jgi:hypothetical protein
VRGGERERERKEREKGERERREREERERGERERRTCQQCESKRCLIGNQRHTGVFTKNTILLCH